MPIDPILLGYGQFGYKRNQEARAIQENCPALLKDPQTKVLGMVKMYCFDLKRKHFERGYCYGHFLSKYLRHFTVIANSKLIHVNKIWRRVPSMRNFHVIMIVKII